jgi:hypothetical protein
LFEVPHRLAVVEHLLMNTQVASEPEMKRMGGFDLGIAFEVLHECMDIVRAADAYLAGLDLRQAREEQQARKAGTR